MKQSAKLNCKTNSVVFTKISYTKCRVLQTGQTFIFLQDQRKANRHKEHLPTGLYHKIEYLMDESLDWK